MRRLAASLAAALALLCASAGPALGAFGFKEAELSLTDPLGAPALQAGSHPFATEIGVEMETEILPGGSEEFPEGEVEDLTITLPEGFAVNSLAAPTCSAAEFVHVVLGRPSCPDASALGIAAVKIEFRPISVSEQKFFPTPIYNLEPPPGVAGRLGFVALGVPVTIDGTLEPAAPHRVQAHVTNIAQAAVFYSSITTLWGDPGAPQHDPFRGACLSLEQLSDPGEPQSSGEQCPVDAAERTALVTSPRSCTGPLRSVFEALSWPTWSLDPQGNPVASPPERDSIEVRTEPGMVNCAALPFGADVFARPTTDRVESPSGLDFELRIEDPGLTNPEEGATAASDIKRAVVTLPEGVTINPSQAEGLAVCSQADLARESASSPFGAGCPAASKIGTIEVQTPLLEEVLRGSLFVATPYANLAGDSLIAFYIVIKSPERGVLVKQAARVEPDPRTGQLVTIADGLPQQPFSSFRLRFREGGRSPLITPRACGTYTTKALLTPWANPQRPIERTSSFQIARGLGPCPPAGPPPFAPGLSAGTLNNQAGSYSPFALRLTRRDGDQDLTRFDATLPPGMVAKLAGVSICPDAAIAQLGARSGSQELASPSCPPNSRIAAIQAGAGVGSQLTYVEGSAYLAGPFAGAPLSVVGVVPAVAGPFDVGVVSTRQALTLDPVSARPHLDGARSEPIPHILAGIPLRVRDIQVGVERPQFTLNPTSCEPMATDASIWGGGLDVFSILDDAPVPRSARFQAADCASLAFKPRLAFVLKGGTKRGANPALTAVLRPRPGDANLKRTVVSFPRATFLDQAHIRTVCTRVQFARDACPPGSIYGRVRAFTPLLDDPLQGPVYLRSSDNQLPDIVFDLKGLIDIEAAARADSLKGRLRVTFPAIPDAPVSKVVVRMRGAKRGLLINSRNICAPPPRTLARLTAHNAKRRTLRPALRAKGCGAKARKARRARR